MDYDWGYEPGDIAKFKEEVGAKGYLLQENDGDQAAFFYFLGKQSGQEYICDTSLSTLRYEHAVEVFELAAQRSMELMRQLYGAESTDDLTEEQAEEFEAVLDDTLAEIEQEEEVKVKESLIVEPFSEHGLLVEASRNIASVDERAIHSFIEDFNSGDYQVSEQVFSFQEEEDEEQ